MTILANMTTAQKAELLAALSGIPNLPAGVLVSGAAAQVTTLETSSLSQSVTAQFLAARQREFQTYSALTAPLFTPLGMFVVTGCANLTKPYSCVPSVKGGGGLRTFSYIGTLPAGLAFNTAIGEISGTPTATGTTILVIVVSDATGVVTSLCSIFVGAAPVAITASADTTGATDKAAINSALTAGNSVSLTGTYYINGTLKSISNTAIYGATNTEIRLAAGSNCQMWANTNQSTTTRTDTNMTIVGDGTFYWNGQASLQVRGATNVRLFDCLNLISANNVQLIGLKLQAAGPATGLFGCTNVDYRNIYWNQDNSQANQDGLDIGSGSRFIHARAIRGASYDDCFSFFAKRAQAASAMMAGIPFEFGADTSDIYVSDVRATVGLNNMFRLQAGTGWKNTRIFAWDINNAVVPSATDTKVLVQFGATDYLPIPPKASDYAEIRIDGASGFTVWVNADTSVQDVKIRNILQNCKLLFGVQAANSLDTGTVTSISAISIDGVVDTYTGGAHGVLLGNFLAGTNPSFISVSNAAFTGLSRFVSTDAGISGLYLANVSVANSGTYLAPRSTTISRGVATNVTVAGTAVDLSSIGVLTAGASLTTTPVVSTSTTGTTIENVPYSVALNADRIMNWAVPASSPFTVTGSTEAGWKLNLPPQLYASTKSAAVTLRGLDLFGNAVTWTHTVTITADATLLPNEDPAYSVYKTSRATPLSTARAQATSDFLAGLRADGVLPLLDRLVVAADEASTTDAVINIVDPTAPRFTMAGTFTASLGIAGNGTSQTPISFVEQLDQRGKFSLNSGAYGVYCNQQNGVAGTKPHLGGTAVLNNRLYATDSGLESFGVNTSAAGAGTRTSTSRVGHRIASRTASNLTTHYYNGTAAGTSVNVSAGVSYNTACVGRDGTTYCADRFALAWTGSGVTASQATAIHARIYTFLNSFGAA